MAKIAKTNAIRIIEKENVDFNIYEYSDTDGKIDGVSVAEKISKEIYEVYKTLVAVASDKTVAVFVIPVAEELDLKKAAKAVGAKSVEMLPVKDLLKTTGYIRGGCSPIGMKKNYPLFIDDSASKLKKIIVSAGKIGLQVELDIDSLIRLTNGELKELLK